MLLSLSLSENNPIEILLKKTDNNLMKAARITPIEIKYKLLVEIKTNIKAVLKIKVPKEGKKNLFLEFRNTTKTERIILGITEINEIAINSSVSTS